MNGRLGPSVGALALSGKDIAWNRGDIWVVIAYAVWGFINFAYSWDASGRTAGMALFGVRVVQDDGTDARGRRAVVRTLALPLSFLFLGLGFVGILLGGQRRALHGVIAGTAVIYSWDARAARLRYLSRGLILQQHPAGADYSSCRARIHDRAGDLLLSAGRGRQAAIWYPWVSPLRTCFADPMPGEVDLRWPGWELSPVRTGRAHDAVVCGDRGPGISRFTLP